MINKKSLKIIILGVIFISITTVFYIFSLTESKEEGISVDEGFYGVNQEGNLSIQKIEIVKTAKVAPAKLYYLRNYKKKLKETKVKS